MGKLKSITPLYPETGFWVSVGSIFDISGDYFSANISKSGKEADYKALKFDAKKIGDDMKKIVKKELLELL